MFVLDDAEIRDELFVNGTIGVGSTPDSRFGVFVAKIATGFGALAVGIKTDIRTEGAGFGQTATGLDNTLLASGLGDTTNGFIMSSTSANNGNTANGAVISVADTSGKINQILNGFQMSMFLNADSTVRGVSVSESDDGARIDPSNEKYGYYIRWDIPGSDVNRKKWSFFNDGSNTISSNMFLGKDDIKSYWGTGFNASINYDGINLVINPDEVGSGLLEVDGSVNVTGDINASGQVCDSTGCIGSGTASGGSSPYKNWTMVEIASNTTKLTMII